MTSLKSTFDPHIHGKVPAHLASYYIYQFIIITWFVPLLIGLVLGITDMAIRNFTRCSLVGGEILEFDYISDKSKAAPPDTTATGAVRIDMTASDLIATDPAPTDSSSPSTAEPSLSKTKRAETIVLID